MEKRATVSDVSTGRSAKKKATSGLDFSTVNKALATVPVFVAKVALATVVVVAVGRAMGVSI